MALLISLLSRWSAPGLLLVGWLAAGAAVAAAQGPGIEEHRVKAVFVLNFVHFVRWPPAALPPGDGPLVIGVLGTDPLEPYLQEAVRGEKLGDHPITVRVYPRVEEVAGCQVLFIGQSETEELDRILALLRDRSILTVGDAERFSEHGGIIGLVTANNKVRLKINLGAARAADLRIDARLLRPAQIVATEKG